MDIEHVIHVVDRLSHKCQHNRFIFDDQLSYVACGLCGKHLNPIWVIGQFANHEHRLCQTLAHLKRLIEETRDKTRCKCEHCGKVTRIANQREASKASF